MDTGEEITDFDDFVDLLRVRIGHADALFPSRLHDFRGDLMPEYAETIPETWWWAGLEELQALGHLDDNSQKLNGGDACGRLSADGRAYLRDMREL